MFKIPEEFIIHLHLGSLGGYIGALIAFLFLIFSLMMVLINTQDRLAFRYLAMELVFVPCLFGYALYQSQPHLSQSVFWIQISFSGYAFTPFAYRFLVNWILRKENWIDLIHIFGFGLLSMVFIWFGPAWMRIIPSDTSNVFGYPFRLSGVGFWLFLIVINMFVFYDWQRLIFHFRKNSLLRTEAWALVLGSTVWVWGNFFDNLIMLNILPVNFSLTWFGPSFMLFMMGVYYAQEIRYQGVRLEASLKEKEVLYQQLIHDDLTGTYSRNYFNSILKRTFEENGRYSISHCLLFIDVDDFKLVNDYLGHPVGDRLLVNLSEILKSETRSSDFVARYGGDEFVVLLLNCDLKKAKVYAERVLQRYQSLLKQQTIPFPVEWELPGLSIGITHTKFWGSNRENLINQADQAMYKAKKSGKNRVMIVAGVNQEGSLNIQSI